MNTPLYIPLDNLGTLKVSGPDAASFLQGQLTSDIRTLTPYSHQIGAFCNRMGRVLALMEIYRIDDDYFLTLPNEIIDTIAQTLKKYIVFSKAQIENVSDSYASDALLHADPVNTPSECISFTRKEIQQRFGAVKHLTKPIYPEGTLTDYLLAQMHALIPYIGAAQSGEFLPHPLGLIELNAVSFNKGCFVGQEIIARMQYRTKVKKHLQYRESDTIDTGNNTVNILEISPQHYALLEISDT